MKKYRLGIIGFAHMHVNNVAALYAKHPQVQWIACADTTPIVPELREAPYTRAWNLKHTLTNIGVPRSFTNYHEMLDKEKFDIIIVCSENAQHADIVEACAAKGVNVCVEKPMASSYSHALRMARACQTAKVTLLVNWPTTWSPQERKMKELLDQGVAGRILEVKFRAGHTGPLGPGAAHAGVSEVAAPMSGAERGATWWHQEITGGGAMLDYCCYGAMIAHWYIGQHAVAALGMKANLDSQWGDANDNGAMLVRFPQAMALLEGSWTQWDYGVPGGPIVYGTKGTLVAESDHEHIRFNQGHGHDTIFTPDPLPKGRGDVAEEFIHHLETGEPLHPTLEVSNNLHAMAILDAGVRSATSNKLELVENDTWQIG